MEHISESLEKLKEQAKRRREKFKAEKQKAEGRKTESGGGKPEAGKELFEKYREQIEKLESMEKEIWEGLKKERQVKFLKIVEKCGKYKFYKDSKPPIDLDFVITMYSSIGLARFRKALNDGYAWLKANPNRTKKNYRRFLMNWAKGQDKNVNINIVKNADEDY